MTCGLQLRSATDIRGGGLHVMWKVHQVRHVSPCVKPSLRLRTVVALSGVVVHGMEMHSTRLNGPCPGSTRCSHGR